jgi:hypothetical protein
MINDVILTMSAAKQEESLYLFFHAMLYFGLASRSCTPHF